MLIGATAIPAWFLHHKLLPIHFGTAGLGSAAALLELLGHRIAPLNAIGLLAAAVESALLVWLSFDRHGAADRTIHEHASGWLIRIGEILNGPLALVLRLLGLISPAAIFFLAGALISRFGWIDPTWMSTTMTPWFKKPANAWMPSASPPVQKPSPQKE